MLKSRLAEHRLETYARRTNAAESIFGGSTEIVEDLIELIDIALRIRSETGKVLLYGLTHSPPIWYCKMFIRHMQ